MMTKADYHRLSIVEPYAPLNNVCWTSSNPAVATIEPTGKTPKITGVADGTTIISLVTPGGTVCDSFVLRVYDPTLYAAGSVGKAK